MNSQASASVAKETRKGPESLPVRIDRLAVKHIFLARQFILPETLYTQSRRGRNGLGFALRGNLSTVYPLANADEVE